ncbi:hypothetical protein JCGZ_11538 [Jatropha curcas]|uniref:Formin-like protein n=2 Tax=Jatropha curcas TaxID=180498 RepID=A0A067K4V1_JATCU|nr:hypothetical protein JCGZ_11538 [Jatropha curcas]
MESPPVLSPSSSSSHGKEIIAIVATAAITLIIAAIFFFCYRYVRRRQKTKIGTSFQQDVVTYEEFRNFGGRVKGLVVDENGQEVVYIKDLEDGELKINLSKVVLNSSYEEGEENMTEKRTRKCKLEEVKECQSKVIESVQPNQLVQLPPPPPSLSKKVKALPPPPPPPPPRPLPMIVKRPLIPSPRADNLVSSLRPPPLPRGDTNNVTKKSSGPTSGSNVKKLKPLHWDKVVANTDHSMVWNEIIDGSLRVDDDQIETLFGYKSATGKTHQGNKASPSISSSSAASTQIFILDSRKSQNAAIVIKSLAISRKEILDAILEGHGLPIDILEKLVRISPTQEEEAKILQFTGNPSKLADAESFLYHILKTVPSAFFRMDAMLFRSNYDAEILQLKESLQTLELGCKELRTRGLFLKLLEAILKAGNKMNAGTTRGNAKGFNLTALRQLSDVKSTDGNTTLLHFVVEQVARSEGRRQFINDIRNIERNDGQKGTNSDLDSDTKAAAEEGKEYVLLGLQALGKLRIEFSNVKKAATIEYDSFISTCSSLTTRVVEIQMLTTRCSNSDGGSFVREMKGFLECCGEELKVVAGEQTRIMELVKRTTEYYCQAGASKHDRENLLQMFVIIKDFLDMVDQVCINISKKFQKKNMAAASAESASPPLPSISTSEKFQDFRLHLISDSSRTEFTSESDDEF